MDNTKTTLTLGDTLYWPTTNIHKNTASIPFKQ